MTVPGQWAGGFAAWDEYGVYFATGRAAEPGRVLRLSAPRCCATWAQQWFPFGVALHRRTGPTRCAAIESTARQREALVALGTLAAGLAHEINNPAPRRRRAVDALTETTEQARSPRSPGSPRRGITCRGVHRARRPATRGRRGRGRAWYAGARRPGGRAVRLARRPRRRPRLGDRPTARRRRGRRRLVRAGWRTPWAARPLAPGLEWVASSLSDGRRCSARSRRRPAGSPSSWPRCGRTPRWTARSLQNTDLTEGLDSTLVMLGHKLGKTGSSW